MKKDFNKLEELLFNASTYDSNGNDIWAEVHGLLIELGGKIDEVEKRLEIANKTAIEIESAIGDYTKRVDNNESFIMDINDHDVISRGSRDIMIAVDLKDNEVVENNWYNLFSPTPKVEDEETYPIVNCMDCGHPQPLLEENVHVDKLGRHVVCEQCEGSFNVGGDVEVFMTFHSSWGEIDCDSEGKVLEIRGDEYASDGERSYLYDIAKFDLVEFGKFCESKNITMGEADDILVVGFWKKDNTYNEADRDWRRGDEEPPTMLCKTPQTHEFVKDIIAKLKVIDVDGETMEYILEQVGMKEQMLKQLFAQSTNDEIDYLHDVRNGKG
jgi:hypothetical protein